MTPRLALAAMLTVAAPLPARAAASNTACVRHIEAVTQAFHERQIHGALHYYKSWLPGFETAPPQVEVEVHGAGTQRTFRAQVQVHAEVPVGYSRSAPVACRNPIPPAGHPRPECGYHQATVRLKQTLEVSCRHEAAPDSAWACSLDRRQVHSSCAQDPRVDAPGTVDRGELASMCPTYAPSWQWGRHEDTRATFQTQLVGFIGQQLSCLEPNSAPQDGVRAVTDKALGPSASDE